MNNEELGSSGSVSRDRRRRSEKSSKLSGILFGMFVLALIAGGAWYWTQVLVPQQEAEAREEYDRETMRVSKDLSSKVRQLTEWNAEDVLDRYSNDIDRLALRERVQESLVGELAGKVDGLIIVRADRIRRFESLLEEIRELPLDSSSEKVMAYDERMKKARGEFEKSLGLKLNAVWSEHRKAIVASFPSQKPGELTIRTDPSKATVFMDGKLLATTPFTVGKVRPGDHMLLLKKPGYRDKSVSIVMEDSGEMDLGIQKMEAIVGDARIRVKGGKSKDRIEVEIEEFSEPSTVGGLEIVAGYQYFEGREHLVESLLIGQYTIIVSRNGDVVKREVFVVEEGKTNEVLVRL